MRLDVVDLRTFYASPLGVVTRRFLNDVVRARWSNCGGMAVMGFGYATPYLQQFRSEAVRVIAFMPAEQGVVNWPTSGPSASALVETTALPLPDSCMDRVLVVHALETSEQGRELLAEIWRILTPGGRMILIAPNRGGLWSRVDTTPFGHGQPFSRGQLRELMRETLFSPIHWGEALYAAPFQRRFLLRLAPILEKIGARLSLPGAGVLVVEATKQLYRPVGLRRAARRPLPLPAEPALAPSGASVMPREGGS
ncbi:MAG TPA: class I SAM-dependent methyltransferase [Rhodoblastus sp.]|nr:class I SAM-dependent methyltransferase [Rhodoblastus sp.]